MNKSQLKIEIEKLAKQEGVSFLKACSAMQAAAASKGAEDVIEAIADIKEECDEYKSLFM